ncbi:MAG: endolytic transglycosylase MltG [Candidatus Caldatribacteriaceae bacterium]
MRSCSIFFLCGAWLLCAVFHMAFYADLESGEEKIIIIPKGISAQKVAQILEEKGITSSFLFRLFLFLSQKDKIVAGGYLFRSGTSLHQIVQKLEEGPPQGKITFPEGFTSSQMAEILEIKGICHSEEYLNLVSHPEVFSKEWLQGISHLEGFLFPDTYQFSLATSPREVIKAQLSRFEQLVLPLYRQSNTALSLKEVVILASIVEKETSLKEEKPYVASVFLNRLQKGMKLQSCATVVYAHYLENGVHKKSLNVQDLTIDSPFNTYLYKGLPPQPIGNPGFDSIWATLFPLETDYLYFVLQEDGKHSFSVTYGEHLEKKGIFHETSKK